MERQFHITALAPYKIFPAKTGGQKAISLFYKYFSELIPVAIVSTKNNDQPKQVAFSFLPILSNSRLRYVNPFLYFSFKKIITEHKSTHFIIEHPYFGWLGILLKKFDKITFVVRSHNIESLRFKSTKKWWWRLLWQYEKAIHQSADLSLFITEEDRQYAISRYKVNPEKCHVVTYGIELKSVPDSNEKKEARKKINQLYSISDYDKILFFNGTLSYAPNLAAVDYILHEVYPQLTAHERFPFKIIISGMGLPESYQVLIKSSFQNVIYSGFVEDIETYFIAADIFLNPVRTGGGIKTKLVEALGYNISAISEKIGATGIPEKITSGKLLTVPNNDIKKFVESILSINIHTNTPKAFYDHYYWGSIAKRALENLK